MQKLMKPNVKWMGFVYMDAILESFVRKEKFKDSLRSRTVCQVPGICNMLCGWWSMARHVIKILAAKTIEWLRTRLKDGPNFVKFYPPFQSFLTQ